MSSVYKKLQKRNNEARLTDFTIDNAATGGKLEEYLAKEDKGLLKRIKKTEEDLIREMEEKDVSENDDDLEEGSVKKEDEESSEEEEKPVVKKPDFRDGLRAFADPDPDSKEWKNRQRVLIVCQRGIGGRYRGLLDDLRDLIPHSKHEAKIERKQAKVEINELCFERSCNNFIYFESRNHRVTDLYMWLAKSPNGPSFKFALSNIRSMSETKLTGNCLKYSRPFLSFDGSFDRPDMPHLQLCKELLS